MGNIYSQLISVLQYLRGLWKVAEILEIFLNIQSFNFILFLSLALVSGIILFRYFANTGKIHKLLRYLKNIKEAFYSSPWFRAFSDNITYVVLHLKDKRRIYGWPKEWPSDPRDGHFLLQNACWLEEENGKNKEVPLDDSEGMLIDSANVEMVEFVKNTEEKRND